MNEIEKLLKEQGDAFQEFKTQHIGRVDALEQVIKGLEAKAGRIPAPSGKGASLSGGRFAMTVGGQRIPALGKSDSLASHYTSGGDDGWTIGGFVRASMGVAESKSVTERGSATVPTALSAQIIDAVRAKSRLVQAGAVTIPIEGPTILCKITGDPTVYEHVEGVDDIDESVPTFAPVTMDPKSLVALVPLSLEIVQDSPNLDAALEASISAAFAGKLDALGLAKILADGTVPTSATGQATDTWAGTLSAVGSMLASNAGLPGALICSPGDFIDRAGEVTDGGWLGAPRILENMLDLETSAMSDGTAILGRFDLGFAIAARAQLRLELIRWAKPGSGTHLLACHARLGGYVLQPKHLYVQKKTVA